MSSLRYIDLKAVFFFISELSDRAVARSSLHLRPGKLQKQEPNNQMRESLTNLSPDFISRRPLKDEEGTDFHLRWWGYRSLVSSWHPLHPPRQLGSATGVWPLIPVCSRQGERSTEPGSIQHRKNSVGGRWSLPSSPRPQKARGWVASLVVFRVITQRGDSTEGLQLDTKENFCLPGGS